MSAKDRERTLSDTLYSRSPKEKTEQAAFRRYVTKKIGQLDETVVWLKDYYDAKRDHFPPLFMVQYNHYQSQKVQFFRDLNSDITKKPSSALLKKFEPFLERLDRIVDRMVEIAQSATEIPVFDEREVIPDASSLGERRDPPAMVHKKVPLVHIPMLRRRYEYKFHKIDRHLRSIQADPDISERRLELFNGEKLYYEHLRTTFSNEIEKGQMELMELNQKKEQIDKYAADLEKVVKEIERLSIGPDSPDASDDSSDS